ncbi:MAG: hypothetical protein K8E66_05080, partial [Phycisphaerales bacterium]|nr:hypothetical protein [Phycisphaerales bacterium]
MTDRLVTAVVMILLALAAPLAAAKDVVVLDDGRRVEGDTIREIDGNVWMLVSIGDIKKQEF